MNSRLPISQLQQLLPEPLLSLHRSPPDYFEANHRHRISFRSHKSKRLLTLGSFYPF